jgi:response regulator of citrate/malate metabolism
MTKKRYNKLLPWLSARQDNVEKRFIQVGDTLFFDWHFRELCMGARWLYLCMAMEAAGEEDFQFTESTGRKYGFSHSSLRRYIEELVEADMITRYSKKEYRLPNNYEFNSDWKRARQLE